ncbi:MAG TPA: pre-peptidase C-terminal domain-containing protein [Ideonella sp.]|uniref:pre-peptidase C-terminal domain-containing protein n=1 Tax=Ideonella sp. TaxID=1929293 RepID=UPI002E2EDDDA|nr:pre-peptidase C-terminal domain-containing protein [Ideonella sp.]HEX5684991.1 pre-peptidase C-terminal domain-containing protein [Ideonella sp.]
MQKQNHHLRTALAAAALVLVGTQATAATERAPMPRIALAEAGVSGQRAIDALGSNLDAVAAHYHKTPQALRDMLLRDPMVRLDRHGKLYVVEEMDGPLPSDGKEFVEGTAPAPLADSFTLHSRPGAKRTIYLDFNGAVLQNTAWNSNGNTINAVAFDIDGNVNSFSAAELERIQYIWQRVAEDFAPFDIDVTTEQPSADKLTRSSEADDVFGTTALITNHNGVYNCSCGGVAYVGIYDNVGDYYKPALVFWDMLGSSEKNVAEATSHEVGHNLGLSHDGTSQVGYYTGHGDGATGWAPIMGVGYYKNTVQWSQGEYSDANNKEDDFVVAGNNGGPLRKDDHGNGITKATALTTSPSGNNVNLSGNGVISTRKDKDVFSFSAKAGAGTITVTPDTRSANLDVAVKIMKADGTVLAKAKPADQLGATVTFTLPAAGKYYVSIDGIGYLTPTNGYSDYGSLGQYAITGTVPAP